LSYYPTMRYNCTTISQLILFGGNGNQYFFGGNEYWWKKEGYIFGGNGSNGFPFPRQILTKASIKYRIIIPNQL